MTRSELDTIIGQYERNGWVLRRLLLTTNSPPDLGSRPGDFRVSESDIDAAWFSRPPQRGEYAWEIRYLGPTPFALVEHLDDSNAEFEERLVAVENRLREIIFSKSRGH